MEEKDSSVAEPEEQESRQPERQEFTPEELKEILEEHEKWLVSEGKEGTKANLQKARLVGANLQKANLIGANLQGANLGKANLEKVDLGGSDLRTAILQDADLTGAKGLQGGQLAGSNVSGAKLLEDVAKFEEGLKVVEEASRNARKLFFAMLSACAYALLTIATTTDVRLLTNSASSPLPIIRTEIPIVWFYIAAPLVLLCLYFYFHLYLQRLWEGLAELPAIFPDGRPLDKKAYPWLLTGLVRAHVFHLRERRPPLSRFQELISVALAWWFMPATLICFWLRYLPRQDWWWTGFHIALLVVGVWSGVLFYRLAVGTLRMDETELPLWKKPFKEVTTYKRGVLAVRLGLILFLLSMGTINGVPEFQFGDVRTWVPHAFERFGFSPFANFREKDVSTKPPNWSGKEEEILLVKSAPLRGRNLRHVDAYRAFLVNADLRGADLRGAQLSQANLSLATLVGAKLQGVTLFGAKLKGASLGRANLEGANLVLADLRGATFVEVKRSQALIIPGVAEDGLEILSQVYRHLFGKLFSTGEWPWEATPGYIMTPLIIPANLQKTNLVRANLQDGILSKVDLRYAYLMDANLQGVDFSNASLRGADLRGANIKGAKLIGADLRGSDLRGVRELTIELLSIVKTLHKAKLDLKLMHQIKEKYPHLLEKPKED
ncbi:MAG: pentapeptide repeat-containing protein [Candidatus Hodarchaeota archaeon]